MTTRSFEQLRRLLREISALEHASTLMSWDQEVCMPSRGVRARASSLGFVRNLIYERWASDELKRLLEVLDGSCAPGSLEEAVVREARRQHELATRWPPSAMEARTRLSTEARPVWRRARAEADWSVFAPVMKRVVDINREIAGAIGYEEHPYDALLELMEPGMTSERLRAAFVDIESAVRPLLDASIARDAEAAALPAAAWDQQAQMAFIRLVARSVGFDGYGGRIDLSAYPIANSIGPGDVRMTTNVHPEQPLRGLFGALHELGHVLYAQGLDPALEETPLWGAPSFGIDESQSRFFENVLGKSRPFWAFWLPKLKEAVPGLVDQLDVDAFHAAINRVRPTPILLDADELTYNLHVLVRFEVESGLLDGSLDVWDVPEAWRDGMKRHIGVTVRDDGEGALQDIHWAGCYLGAFTSYTVGDLVAAQLMATIHQAIPGLDGQIEAGDLSELLSWLRTNIHAHGARYAPAELIARATGKNLSTEPWIAYIREKTRQLHPVAA